MHLARNLGWAVHEDVEMILVGSGVTSRREFVVFMMYRAMVKDRKQDVRL
jgi:hypothetical protein